jgi:hypothetical protein
LNIIFNWVYNGTMSTDIPRDEKGRWLVQPEAGKDKQITSANARTMAQKRWDKARKATASRITREAMAIDPTVQNEYDAHALMMAKQYTTVLDSDKPRMDDAEKIAQAMGTAPRTVELRAEQAGTTNILVTDGEALLALLMRRRLGEVVEGEAIPIRSDLQGDAG